MPVDDYQCTISTCLDFYYGLKNYPRRKEYEQICFDTVSSVRAIPATHGKCIDDKTGEPNLPCIYALADTIKKCIRQLNDIPRVDALFYCGYTLVKYCAAELVCG